ncbi:MAG: phosphoribosylamine--glycine ligase [Coriobacteriia bacterium]|nr:phosphoribosylamine--glycine ligase [Coriobacteriia bacterium]
MRVLVIGSGGREHAIVHSLAGSPRVEAIFAAPGNGGTAGERGAVNVALDTTDADAVIAFARENAIDLAVIGPEVPLVAGLADELREAGIPAFGPGAAGARLEGSKSFSKDIMQRSAIPTATAETFSERGPALAYLEGVGAPVVVKADGLAAGKGVTVATSLDEARAAVEECFDGRFGDAGALVVIEEYLEGPEVSLLAFVDGRTVLPMASAQDHKRVGDGDTGPNTGGMGVYSPVPAVPETDLAMMTAIMQRTANALADANIDFRGVLYGGFILTADGPKVLEYNTRFGDPETQVLLPRLKTDLAEVLYANATGELASLGELEWSDDVVVSVVMASGGYPGDYESGKPITGIADAAALPGVLVYHAGTKLADDGTVLTAGGRVLNVTAFGSDYKSAIEKAYDAVSRISFEGAYFRNDIAHRALAATQPGS